VVRRADIAADVERARLASVSQLLFKAARLLNARAIARVAQVTGQPVRVAHTTLLPHLPVQGGIRLTELADRLAVSKQAVGQLVDELEEMGVVRRIADPNDARAKLIEYTARGRAGLLQGLGVLGNIETELAAAVGKRRLQELHRTLGLVVEALEQSGDSNAALHTVSVRSQRTGRRPGS
jgi:DNA-binding MarR family transcriptional regulator